MASGKGKLCVRSFPHIQFPLFTQALQQVSILATNILQKLLSSYTVVEALYTYQTPFNYQIKGWLQHQ